MDKLVKQAVEVVFDKKQKPSMFLSNFFEKKLLKTIKVKLQGRVVKSIYSVDVKLGTGGRRVDLSQYDEKEYTVPEYNNYATITEEDMFDVQLGETEYEAKAANVVDLITDRQEPISDMHRRAEEKQASDGLFFGKIVLADKSEIEFNKKETHTIDVSSAKWTNANTKPLLVIQSGCQLCIDDGLLAESEFNLIMENAGIAALLSNPNFKESSNILNGIKRTDIGIPVEKTPGAMFHGQFSCESYRINLWSYNEKYTIPEGFGFANEGKKVGYIPHGCAVLLPMNPKFNRYYGAMNNVASRATDVGGSRLQLIETEQLPYAYDKLEGGSAWTEAGVKSRPLLVPADIDSFVTFNGIV